MNDVVAPVRNEIDFKAEAHRDPWSVPLDEIDVSNPYLYSEDTWHGFFARLRRDDPVHFCDSPLYGPFWSVTRYRDIMTVDTSHQTYSSDAAFGGITLKDVPLRTPLHLNSMGYPRKSGSQRTLRWRETDSNPRSPYRGRHFSRPARRRQTGPVGRTGF